MCGTEPLKYELFQLDHSVASIIHWNLLMCTFFYSTNEINLLKDEIFDIVDKHSHFLFSCFRGFGTAHFLQNYDNLLQFITTLSYTSGFSIDEIYEKKSYL